MKCRVNKEIECDSVPRMLQFLALELMSVHEDLPSACLQTVALQVQLYSKT